MTTWLNTLLPALSFVLLKRPNADELCEILTDWYDEINERKNTKFYRQYQEIKEEYSQFSQNTPYQIHPNAITTSKMIGTKKIAKRLQELRDSGQINLEIPKITAEKEIKEQSSQQSQIQIPPK